MKEEKSVGFALMDAEKLRAVTSSGGKSVPGKKRTFSTDRNLAAEAGRKGGSRKRLPKHLESSFQDFLATLEN